MSNKPCETCGGTRYRFSCTQGCERRRRGDPEDPHDDDCARVVCGCSQVVSVEFVKAADALAGWDESAEENKYARLSELRNAYRAAKEKS